MVFAEEDIGAWYCAEAEPSSAEHLSLGAAVGAENATEAGHAVGAGRESAGAATLCSGDAGGHWTVVGTKRLRNAGSPAWMRSLWSLNTVAWRQEVRSGPAADA